MKLWRVYGLGTAALACLFVACVSSRRPPASCDDLSLAAAIADDELRSAFDRHLDEILARNGGRPGLNDSGGIAWFESYLLESLVDAYHGTGDVRYLKIAAVRAEAVWAVTDWERGISDYNGRSRAVWSATGFGVAGARYAWPVHAAMILHPMLRFARAVLDRPADERGRAVARSIAARADASLAEFDHQWVPNGVESGAYRWEGDEPIEAHRAAALYPLNMQAALGRAYLALAAVSGDSAHRQRAAALARHVRDHIRLRPDSTAVWDYWPEVEGSGPDDLSHGALVIDFAAQAFRAGIVFSRDDLRAFARTLEGARIKGGFSIRIDGTEPDPTGEYADAIGRWLAIVLGAPEVCGITAGHLRNRVFGTDPVHPQVLEGVAKLMRYCSHRTRLPHNELSTAG